MNRATGARGFLVFLFSVAGSAAQAEPESADRLIAASLILTRAGESLPCEPEQAMVWEKQATNELRRFKSRSRTQRDTAGALLAEAAYLRVRAADLQQRMNAFERGASWAIDEGRPSLVYAWFDREPSLGQCPRLQHWRSRARAKDDEARRLVAKAESVRIADPKRARSLYRQAMKANADLEPELAARIDALGIRSPWRTIGGVLVTGAVIGGALYLADRDQKARNTGPR
jgi:hypothetical protein